ncbi:heavy-metal-associated domain-containing protein [Pseudactinotalea sp. HY158]|uniref:heavy-metal-associated domain-containing protein n=1 Tax=Pseudactinotalea sp. HY158 TaxID=2654547 RepID=UPI00129CDBF6|nr:heavy-metal-associated domain-containing protein [Pseudactinotalea sp. HY158]QGH68215.1 hypothetical protein GCE65_00785 [Pseudactinotalea sp. HY158]
MSSITLTTQPFTCPSCVATIERALGRLPGVTAVGVRFALSRVQVDYDPAAVTPAEIATTVTRLGYPVLSSAPAPVAA